MSTEHPPNQSPRESPRESPRDPHRESPRESPRDPHRESLDEFERTVEKKGRRKMQSKLAGKQSPWFGLGMFGLVGWSVVLPTLFGVFLGTWIDNRWPGQVSWQLTLLFLGVFIGCANAWYWINKEIV